MPLKNGEEADALELLQFLLLPILYSDVYIAEIFPAFFGQVAPGFQIKITIHQNFTFLTANSSVTFVGEKDRWYSHWFVSAKRRNKCAGPQWLLERLL